MYVHSDIIIRSVEYSATLICFGLECSVVNLNEERLASYIKQLISELYGVMGN